MMKTGRRIITSTYNKVEVFEDEVLSSYKGHSLNQLQEKAFARHYKRLNKIAEDWEGLCEITFLNQKKLVKSVKQGRVYPAIFVMQGLWWKEIDLYWVYNILPVSDKKERRIIAPATWPFLPDHQEFLYLQDLTDFRSLAFLEKKK